MSQATFDIAFRRSLARTEGPWKLLGLALAWFLATIAAALLFGAGVGIFVVFRFGLHHLQDAAQVLKAASGRMSLTVDSVVVSQVAMIVASLRRGRRVGFGDLLAGLGWEPIERPWLMGVLAAVLIGYVLCLVLIVTLAAAWGGAGHGTSPGYLLLRLMRWSMASGPAAQVAVVLSMTVAAPVAEELFFRGWLWTGLRRHWGPVTVGFVTSLLWLGAHLGEGWARPLFLIPAAIVLSIGRHGCGSVRATIVLHVINNVAAAGLVAGALVWR